ncbi:C69 family dipeptidase, partial [Faecalibacillus intestinalis]|nr:C69 family dipeptidase [Faecalibacillus intestinalis]
MMVGKHASTDGFTFISRNEDRVKAIEPKRFLVRPAVKNRQAAYVSAYNQLTVPLPADSMRYTATPSVDQTQGPNEEDG